MKKIKKNRGIEQLKSRYGIMFTMPWLIGIIIFFIIPFVQVVWFSFSEMTVSENGFNTVFVGLKNYKDALFVDAYYTEWLKSSMTSFLYSLPIILMLSMVLAIILNQKFRGRLFFRALYFLPVIIASGTVITLIFRTSGSDLEGLGASETYASNMFSVEDIIGWLNIDGKIADYITLMINKIFDLVWNCGIQTVLFLAGLQSVPTSLYEVSRVEGATKWEEFWFITFPMLSRVTLLVGVFTMVELVTAERGNIMVEKLYGMMRAGVYDRSAAMILIYFVVATAFMGIVVLLYTKLIAKRWE